jgi:hypothetical protein
VRQHIRSFIEAMLESELEAVLNLDAMTGHRHGHHDRQILGTFSPTTVSVPRVRLAGADGTTGRGMSRPMLQTGGAKPRSVWES